MKTPCSFPFWTHESPQPEPQAAEVIDVVCAGAPARTPQRAQPHTNKQHPSSKQIGFVAAAAETTEVQQIRSRSSRERARSPTRSLALHEIPVAEEQGSKRHDRREVDCRDAKRMHLLIVVVGS